MCVRWVRRSIYRLQYALMPYIGMEAAGAGPLLPARRVACSRQWGTSDLGATYGGFLAGCNGNKDCVRNKCNTIFASKPDLLAGCNWFLGWFNAADNPNFVYQRIACPAAITQRSGLSDPGN